MVTGKLKIYQYKADNPLYAKWDGEYFFTIESLKFLVEYTLAVNGEFDYFPGEQIPTTLILIAEDL